jgi:alpha-tubulin suppressor-like RCC1 family protein
VNFDNYYKPVLRAASSGSHHSAFLDDIGRLFVCGYNEHGQLGLGDNTNERKPYYVTRIQDQVQEVACGSDHTLVLTRKGEVYAMGSNLKGQLGTGKASKGTTSPVLLEELSFCRMVKIRAGSFSASLSTDG